MQFLMACQGSHTLTNFLVMENTWKTREKAKWGQNLHLHLGDGRGEEEPEQK